VCVGYIYKGFRVNIGGLNLKVNVMYLKLHEFDLILRMNWMSDHKAQMDCFAKLVTL
jgi:hypothetical protein